MILIISKNYNGDSTVPITGFSEACSGYVFCYLAGVRLYILFTQIQVIYQWLILIPAGYLAEEQLMTAYDEFLQASPYLDALRNEYDRILMTSLKHILAEYRAVKIYGMLTKINGIIM